MTADESTGTSSTFIDRTTTTHQTVPTSTYSSSETDGSVYDQKPVISGSDQFLSFLDDKPTVGATTSAKGKEDFNRALVKDTEKNEALLEARKEPPRRISIEFPQQPRLKLADTLQDISEESKLTKLPRHGWDLTMPWLTGIRVPK